MKQILIYTNILFPWLPYFIVKKFGKQLYFTLPTRWYINIFYAGVHGPTFSIYIKGIEIRFIGWSKHHKLVSLVTQVS